MHCKNEKKLNVSTFWSLQQIHFANRYVSIQEISSYDKFQGKK